MIDFLKSKGFVYNELEDEWNRPTFDGVLVVWKKHTQPNMWELLYEDKEEYLHPLFMGNPEIISGGLVQIERDIKISELLN